MGLTDAFLEQNLTPDKVYFLLFQFLEQLQCSLAILYALAFCCVGALAIAERLDLVERDLLGWWLAERQLPCGGLNGRPEKLPDVCYSWWVLSTLCAINRDHWIDGEKLKAWILQCQVKSFVHSD